MSDFNKRERQLISSIITAETYIRGDWELEMHYVDGVDGLENGWYAWKYNEEHGEAVPINDEYREDPLITDEDVEKYNVDLDRVFRKFHCYVSG